MYFQTLQVGVTPYENIGELFCDNLTVLLYFKSLKFSGNFISILKGASHALDLSCIAIFWYFLCTLCTLLCNCNQNCCSLILFRITFGIPFHMTCWSLHYALAFLYVSRVPRRAISRSAQQVLLGKSLVQQFYATRRCLYNSF